MLLIGLRPWQWQAPTMLMWNVKVYINIATTNRSSTTEMNAKNNIQTEIYFKFVQVKVQRNVNFYLLPFFAKWPYIPLPRFYKKKLHKKGYAYSYFKNKPVYSYIWRPLRDIRFHGRTRGRRETALSRPGSSRTEWFRLAHGCPPICML